MKRLIAAMVVIGGLGLVGWHLYANMYQQLTLTDTNATNVTLYRAAPSESGPGYNAQKPVLTLDNVGSYRVKKALYVYVARAGNGFESATDQLPVGKQPVSFSVQLAYTSQHLQQLLPTEGPLALQALDQAYPSQMALYTPENGKLYDDGQWYGVKLVANDGVDDTYRAVVEKEGDRWQVATRPPAIALSHPVYPNIPQDILSDVDSF
jgi:hypothetical protein